MANVNVLEIKIKAQLPIGKTLEEAHDALSIARMAQDTGDYSELLSSASIVGVTIEQRTRRIADAV